MTKPYVMSMARAEDFDTVMRLLKQRIDWLRELGSDQWNTGRSFDTRVRNSISRQETWLLNDGDEPIATLTLTSEGDPDFWTPSELADRALYLGKMATSRSRSGSGLGKLAITWASDFAAKRGFEYVRWDVWRTNKRLQDYYRSVGARYIRTEDVADRWSGALFEVDARMHPELDREVQTTR
ncbi:GNAT family N-acetyltransferase [Saccharothrix coeruleofusca]|uniref:N-acetyltransferase domain-containing protein n=1 Tax=Saccharothrix coeruleofusca TaxID=33919 RepID=A0A918EAR4_9PSEU|nr:hypothetical protein GCM10010185_03670 [Saccharothrix coeruleofusca]